MVNMAKMCKVLINCVGPYRHWGEQTVKACVESGTHHVDVSGEPEVNNLIINFCKFLNLIFSTWSECNSFITSRPKRMASMWWAPVDLTAYRLKLDACISLINLMASKQIPKISFLMLEKLFHHRWCELNGVVSSSFKQSKSQSACFLFYFLYNFLTAFDAYANRVQA